MNYYYYYYMIILLLIVQFFFFTVKLHQGFFILVSRLVLSLVFLFGCHIKIFGNKYCDESDLFVFDV